MTSTPSRPTSRSTRWPGPIQTYRITGDPRILRDAEMTVDLFDRFFLDREKGGYFSHLDPVTLDPRSESLGANKGKKNWNSVGDHAPAYLINLYLATGEDRYAEFLEHTFDTIAKHFPDYDAQPVRAGEVLRGLVATTARTCGSRTAASSATTSRSPGT